MFDAVWYLDCILPSSVVLFMECMGYRFLKGEKQSLDDVSAELDQTAVFLAVIVEGSIATMTCTTGAFSFQVSMRSLLHL